MFIVMTSFGIFMLGYGVIHVLKIEATFQLSSKFLSLPLLKNPGHRHYQVSSLHSYLTLFIHSSPQTKDCPSPWVIRKNNPNNKTGAIKNEPQKSL